MHLNIQSITAVQGLIIFICVIVFDKRLAVRQRQTHGFVGNKKVIESCAKRQQAATTTLEVANEDKYETANIMVSQFEQRFEQELQKIVQSLECKGGTNTAWMLSPMPIPAE